jgi:isopenicillin-N epimerase
MSATSRVFGRIAARTHALARQLKEGLRSIDGVTLHTPSSEDFSAGIVSFDIGGRSPASVVSSLRARNLIASVAPYATQHVRLTPSIRNSSAEVEEAIRLVRALA